MFLQNFISRAKILRSSGNNYSRGNWIYEVLREIKFITKEVIVYGIHPNNKWLDGNNGKIADAKDGQTAQAAPCKFPPHHPTNLPPSHAQRPNPYKHHRLTMDNKIACEIKIIKAENGEVTYEQICPDSPKSFGGVAKQGDTIRIYQHEIKTEL